MSEKLSALSTEKLLEKFGAGNHKPGSGSASALQGMLAAKMLLTVIDLTVSKPNYRAYQNELRRIKNEINLRIYPSMSSLFQEDSDQFDIVIKLREQRNKEQDPIRKRALADSAIEELKPATEIPLEIALLCIEVADFAAYVFDNGFRAARGDSGVALNAAIGAISSCLCIIELNLTTLGVDERSHQIRQRKKFIKDAYNRVSAYCQEKLGILEKEAEEKMIYNLSLAKFRIGNLANSIYSDQELEQLVRELQNALWIHRDRVWKDEQINNPMELLKPDVVLEKVMGYHYSVQGTLGIHRENGELFEIAGLIDKNKKVVQISKQFPTETQKFTAAHELAHLILHEQMLLHRDKPLDGSSIVARKKEEIQADKFAAYFLMPGTLVKEVFEEAFKSPRFAITEKNAHALIQSTAAALKAQCPSIRGLARLLASADYFNGKFYTPIACIFGVSVETMAIRLEELGLISWATIQDSGKG